MLVRISIIIMFSLFANNSDDFLFLLFYISHLHIIVDSRLMLYVFLCQPSRCVNQIEEVCKDIEKTINQTIQNTLNQLERDCEQISSLVDNTIKADNKARSHNFRAKV